MVLAPELEWELARVGAVVLGGQEEVEEEEVMEGEDQFGLTSINIDVFFSLFKVDF